MITVKDIRKIFIDKYRNKDFFISRNNNKTIEIIGASFLADEKTIFGELNKDYIKAEKFWYQKQSTNINDLDLEKIPDAWNITSNKHGQINSNYGKLVYGDLYFNQFKNAVNELKNKPYTRRATMVYTRPSIWYEYNEEGKDDFICTNAVTYYIRDSYIDCVVQMRSNDAIFGYKNDYDWQYHILRQVCLYTDKLPGNIHWQVQNLHIYERHFKYLEN